MKKIFGILICMLMIGTVTHVVSGTENWTELQILTTLDEEAPRGPISISGDTVIIGYEYDDTYTGAAYVFTRSGTTWVQQAKLVASDHSTWDSFGSFVSLDEDTALITIGRAGYEAVYVFKRTGTTWAEQAKLTPTDEMGITTINFGWGYQSLALDGDTAFIGASGDDDNGDDSGSVYVFTRTGTTWILQQKLTASDGGPFDRFGCSISLSNDTIIIGAEGDDNNKGAVYVFTRSGTTWTQQQKFTPSDSMIGDYFGYSISLDGDTALIGASCYGTQDCTTDDLGYSSGSVYVFTRTGTTWAQQAKLLTLHDLSYSFGLFVSLSGDTAFIGSPDASVFTRTGATWTQQKLFNSDGTEWLAWNQDGWNVCIDGDTAIMYQFGWSGDGVFVFTKGGGDEPSSENQPPVVSFTWAPSSPKVNQTITFDASASSDQDGSITKYEWDWNNDGTYDDSTTTKTITHSWAQVGSYSVKLQVTDNDGATSTKTLSVTVSSSSDGGGDGGTEDKGTPGFELIIMICAIAMLTLLWKRKRK